MFNFCFYLIEPYITSSRCRMITTLSIANKETEQDVLAKLEQNIINSISVLKDQVLNLKNIIIKKYKKTMIDSMLNAIN